MLLPAPAPDGKVYLRTIQAAEAFGVKPDTIRRWQRLGYLERAFGQPGLFEYTAVARAEKKARDAAIATSGTNRRVIRSRAA